MDVPIAYNSGNIRAISETLAFIRVGAPIGITVNSQENIIEHACSYACAGGKVFIESGAFTAFNQGKNIDINSGEGQDFWDRVFQIYNDIADSAGPGVLNMAFVAPDQVGDPDISHRNLDWLSYKTNEIWTLGADVIQPIQKYKDEKGCVKDIATRIADLSNWYSNFEEVIIGFPSKKSAWNVPIILDYLKWVQTYDEIHDWTPAPLRIHLLGKGDPEQLVKFQWRMNKLRPNISLSGDSVATASLVGQGRQLTERFNKMRPRIELKLYRYLTKPERGRLRGYILGEIETERRQKAIKLHKELVYGRKIQNISQRTEEKLA